MGKKVDPRSKNKRKSGSDKMTVYEAHQTIDSSIPKEGFPEGDEDAQRTRDLLRDVLMDGLIASGKIKEELGFEEKTEAIQIKNLQNTEDNEIRLKCFGLAPDGSQIFARDLQHHLEQLASCETGGLDGCRV